MRIATLNVQNLRLQSVDGRNHLHGAWDSDDPQEESLDPIDRRLTAELVKTVDADVLALQEVFDLETLEYFHENFLLPAGVAPYPHRICIDGNDGRGLDVALLSRLPVDTIRSHAAITPSDIDIALPPGVDPDFPVFRRDCLMVTIGLLSIFVCHFKSPYPDQAKSWITRRVEALTTRWLIEHHFDDPAKDLWLIVGDLNEPDKPVADCGRAISPLENGFAVDLMDRLPAADRWTRFDHHMNQYLCPDAILASHALAQKWPDVKPAIVRQGLGKESERFQGSRFAAVGQHRPHASDHAAVVIDFLGL